MRDVLVIRGTVLRRRKARWLAEPACEEPAASALRL